MNQIVQLPTRTRWFKEFGRVPGTITQVPSGAQIASQQRLYGKQFIVIAYHVGFCQYQRNFPVN